MIAFTRRYFEKCIYGGKCSDIIWSSLAYHYNATKDKTQYTILDIKKKKKKKRKVTK